MAWERVQRFRFGASSWTLWLDKQGRKPRWIMTADREGVSVEPKSPGLNSKKEAMKVLAELLAPRIRDLRVEAGITQEELAGRLGVRLITVSRWERGEQVPSRDALEKLTEFVNSQNR